MANAFFRFGISDAELAQAIATSSEVDAGLKDEAQKVADYWVEQSPIDEGDYAASVKVLSVRHGKAVVGTKHWKAHMIEFGTKADPEGSKSPFGPDTPTPAFAVGQRVAEHFGGDLTGDGLE
ncbi:HK97 gp10 family phage protein [Mycolicibacterium austroafricanum]|uniref:HK97 gp10 family phage protein n=1 Tax=Mycolicibacterium austroafricanum TaxID=39687 RepID=UPI001ABEFB2D|nr:HK97 gp10 family phage protein [Mycolicibacterium austroafricanum]QRZ05893.1 HK97 gp10 family phage protein [Mycolicibacterium austroafricanum]